MADREKVIKGLEKCLNPNLNCYHDDIDCPYEEQCWLSDSLPTRPLKEEALDLLKEQEAVEPKKQIEKTEWTVCGNCNGHIIHKWKSCPYCGKPISWEGR